MLALWRRLLAPGGTLIVADVIPPHVGPLSDGIALLRYAAANGFLVAALIGLARTALSRYRHLRSELGIARYSEADFLDKLRAAGFAGERLARNVEHNPARMTFRARLHLNFTAVQPTAGSALTFLLSLRMRSGIDGGIMRFGPVADWKRRGAATPLRPGSNPGPGLQFSRRCALKNLPVEASTKTGSLRTQLCAAPTVSAMTAPRAPSGLPPRRSSPSRSGARSRRSARRRPGRPWSTATSTSSGR